MYSTRSAEDASKLNQSQKNLFLNNFLSIGLDLRETCLYKIFTSSLPIWLRRRLVLLAGELPNIFISQIQAKNVPWFDLSMNIYMISSSSAYILSKKVRIYSQKLASLSFTFPQEILHLFNYPLNQNFLQWVTKE